MTLSLTSTSFYITGGTLSTSASSYVVRQADTDLYRYLRHGEFCYVFNSRQMGKSSLMVRTAEKLKAEGVSVAVLDLTSIGQNLTPEQWYDGLLIRLGKQLDLEDALEDFFQNQDRLSPLRRWQDALTVTVLPSTAAESKSAASPLLAIKPFSAPQPSRRIALAWRASFPRPQAVEALRQAILACKLPGVTFLSTA